MEILFQDIFKVPQKILNRSIAYSQSRRPLSNTGDATVTHMFKFLHAVLHGSGKSLIPPVPDVFWVRAVMERRGGDRPDEARRGCASGGDERRFHHVGLDGAG